LSGWNRVHGRAVVSCVDGEAAWVFDEIVPVIEARMVTSGEWLG
jgi:hypothetical protein